MGEAAGHTLVALALVLGYIAITLHGDDGNALIGALSGYGAGVGVTKAAQTTGKV